jgi:hypothetical protein
MNLIIGLRYALTQTSERLPLAEIATNVQAKAHASQRFKRKDGCRFMMKLHKTLRPQAAMTVNEGRFDEIDAVFDWLKDLAEHTGRERTRKRVLKGQVTLGHR